MVEITFLEGVGADMSGSLFPFSLFNLHRPRLNQVPYVPETVYGTWLQHTSRAASKNPCSIVLRSPVDRTGRS